MKSDKWCLLSIEWWWLLSLEHYTCRGDVGGGVWPGGDQWAGVEVQWEEDGGWDDNQEDVGRDADGGEVRNPKDKEKRLKSELMETQGERNDSAD